MILKIILITCLVFNFIVAFFIHRSPRYAKVMAKRAKEGRGIWYFAIQSLVLVFSVPLLFIGAVVMLFRDKGLVQTRNPKKGRWVLIDKGTGKIIGTSDIQFNVPVINKEEKDEE